MSMAGGVVCSCGRVAVGVVISFVEHIYCRGCAMCPRNVLSESGQWHAGAMWCMHLA